MWFFKDLWWLFCLPSDAHTLECTSKQVHILRSITLEKLQCVFQWFSCGSKHAAGCLYRMAFKGNFPILIWGLDAYLATPSLGGVLPCALYSWGLRGHLILQAWLQVASGTEVPVGQYLQASRHFFYVVFKRRLKYSRDSEVTAQWWMYRRPPGVVAVKTAAPYLFICALAFVLHLIWLL